jgi:ribosomal protein L37AE/L43A
MMKNISHRILECIYCKRVSIYTRAEIKVYVCDDCNEKNKTIFENQRRKSKNDKKAKGTYNRYRHGGRKGER